jgi:hypothetical protein
MSDVAHVSDRLRLEDHGRLVLDMQMLRSVVFIIDGRNLTHRNRSG